MKAFQGGRLLRTSSLPLRVTMSWFLLFVGLGYATNFTMLAWKTGLTPAGIAAYYRGDEAAMQFPKELRELVENLHFHVYIVPIVLLVLTHVFYMTAWSERAKVSVTNLAYAAAAADLAAPFLVRFAGAGFAWWKLVSATLYHGTLFFLVLVPLYECWAGGARAPNASLSDDDGSGLAPPDL
jgi:hypothetical protein